MALMIPVPSRIKPLTRTTVEELMRRRTNKQSHLIGYCSQYSRPEQWGSLSPDEDEAIHGMKRVAAQNHRLFVMNEPNIANQPGANFGTYFYHPELTQYLWRILRGSDFDLEITLTPEAEGLAVEVVSKWVTVQTRSCRLTYAAVDPPVIEGPSVHDEGFLKRAVPVFRRTLARPDGSLDFGAYVWDVTCPTSYGEGIAGFVSNDRVRILYDLRRFPELIGSDAGVDADSQVAWFDLMGTNRLDEVYLIDSGVELLREALMQRGVTVMPEMDRRFFFQERYFAESAKSE